MQADLAQGSPTPTGVDDLLQVAKATADPSRLRILAILDQHEPPPMDEAVDEALRDFVTRRKGEMEDAWY